jgi:hypothetical protein
MGDRKRIVPLFCFLANRARNRTVIRTQIRTSVDGPLVKNAGGKQMRVGSKSGSKVNQ